MTNAIAQMALTASNNAAAAPAAISKGKGAAAAKKPAKPAAVKADKKPAAQKKPAAVKAEKVETLKPEQAPAKPAFDAEEARKGMHAAIIERFTKAGSSTLETDAKFFSNDPEFARNALKSAHAAGVNVAEIIARIPCNEKTSSAFIGVKVITKIRQFLTAIHTKNPRDCDGYTNAIIRNVLVNGALDVHDMMRCVSRMVEADALRDNKAVTAYKSSSANTADTQTSSSRMMLGIVGVMNVSKGKKGDRPAFIKTDISRAYRAIVKAAYNIETENATAEIAEGASTASNA